MRESGNIPAGETLAREHLANERTLLSWMRTGMNSIGIGILLHALAGIAGGERAGEFAAFGVALVVFGAVVQLFAAARFLRYRTDLLQARMTSSGIVYLFVTVGFVLLGVAYIGYVVISAMS